MGGIIKIGLTINKAAIDIKKERNIKETLFSLRLNKIYIPKNPNKTTVLIFMKLAISRKKTALLYSYLIINFIPKATNKIKKVSGFGIL